MRLAVIDDHPLVFDAVDIAIKSIPGEHVASGFATLAAFDQIGRTICAGRVPSRMIVRAQSGIAATVVVFPVSVSKTSIVA